MRHKKDRSLKIRSNFLSSCKPLGTIIQFILFNKCSHFSPSYSFPSSISVDFTELLIFLRLFPFNRCRGFAGDVEDDAVDALDFVDDAAGNFIEEFMGDGVVFGGHGVGGGDGAQADHMAVGAFVAHDADGAYVRQGGEGLPDFTGKAGLVQFFTVDGVSFTEDVTFFFGDFAKDADAESRSGEGVAPNEGGVNAEF